MAEALGIAASIISVIELSEKVVKYLDDVKGFSEEQKNIVNEITDTFALLNRLRWRLDTYDHAEQRDWYVAAQGLVRKDGRDGALLQYNACLEELEQQLSSSKESNKIKHAFMSAKWPFKKAKVAEILEKAERLKSLIQVALQMDQFELSQGTDSRLSHVERTMTDVERHTAQLADDHTSKQTKDMACWLSKDDHSLQHTDFISKRQAETGQWFLNSSEFKQWKQGRQHTLYCPGNPGTGKTIMAATAIDHLNRTIRKEDTPVTFLYCTYTHQEEQTTTTLLRALLRQLAICSSVVPQPIQELYDRSKDQRTVLSEHELAKAVETAISTFEKVFLIIDALDECGPPLRSKLLSILHSIQEKSALSLLATAQDLPDIRSQLQPCVALKIQASEADVTAFVGQHICDLSSCVQKSNVLRTQVIAAVVDAVDGMFLLAPLLLGSLKDKRTIKDVRSALENSPSGSDAYDKLYELMMRRIHAQPKGDVELASRTISWVLRAKRPLSPLELQEALAIEPVSTSNPMSTLLDPDNFVDIDEVLTLCAGLVILKQETNIIELVHYTAHEYLTRNQSVWLPKADSILGIACVSYLSHPRWRECMKEWEDDIDERGGKDVALYELRHHRLLRYAAVHWGHHVRGVELYDKIVAGYLDHNVTSPTIALLEDDDLASWCAQVMSHLEPYWYSQWLIGGDPTRLAAHFGLEFVLRHFQAKGIDLDRKCLRYGITPLVIGATRGNNDVVDLLLCAKCQPDTQDVDGVTPLMRAAESGHTAVVNTLLEHAADASIEDQQHWTACHYAAQKGHASVVKLLHDKRGADVDHEGGGYTPLYLAVQEGHVKTVECFLEQGKINVNHQSPGGMTSLSFAARLGHVDIAERLLKADGLVLDLVDWEGQEPIHWAAERGHVQIVKLLFEIHNVDANRPDANLRSPLSWAASRGQIEVAKVLLKDVPDIDVNCQDSEGRTPLSLAAKQSLRPMVELLLADQRTDVDHRDHSRRTPLSHACDLGENTNSMPDKWRNQLLNSPDWSWSSKGEIADLLLATNKVNVNSQDCDGDTPMHMAVWNGLLACVRALLGSGQVNLSLKNNLRFTPLDVARGQGFEEIAKLLERAAAGNRSPDAEVSIIEHG